jgi:glycosyltransferase involved in cell wall biosynthesis
MVCGGKDPHREMSMQRHPRVMVFHPGMQHARFLVAAVQRTGYLTAFVTGLYFAATKFPFNLLRFLPRRLQNMITNRLTRRFHADIDPQRVVLMDFWLEMLFIVLRRVRFPARWLQRFVLWKAHRFSGKFGIWALGRADIVIGTDDASLEAFRILKSQGVICILDLARPPTDQHYNIAECKLADYVLVASSFSRQILVNQQIRPDRIKVIPYGIDTIRFHPAMPGDHPTLRLLFVGRVERLKGLQDLLEAVQALRAEGLALELTVCGALVDAALLERYPGICRYAGQLSAAEIPEMYRQSDIFVFPSHLDGFGFVLLEAMASGLPVITTPHTAGPDLITDGVEGYIVPVQAVAALKERIRMLAADRALCRTMGQAARKRAEGFTWDHYNRRIGDMLNEIWHQRGQVQ